MRKLTGAAFVSLDGVMQAPGGLSEDPTGGFDEGGWVFGVGDDVIDLVLGRLFIPPYALLLGRRTYDIFAAYWPSVEGEMASMGQALTAAEKHVLTRGSQPLAWANSHRLDGIAAVQALKESAGPDLLIQGSSTLYPPLLAAGLIDELVLMTFPVVLGSGKRLFGEGTPPGALQLLDYQVGSMGLIVTRWAGRACSHCRPPRPEYQHRGRRASARNGGRTLVGVEAPRPAKAARTQIRSFAVHSQPPVSGRPFIL